MRTLVQHLKLNKKNESKRCTGSLPVKKNLRRMNKVKKLIQSASIKEFRKKMIVVQFAVSFSLTL